MNSSKVISPDTRRRALPVLLCLTLALAACAGSDEEESETVPSTGAFNLVTSLQTGTLVEGDDNGLVIDLAIVRDDGHTAPVQLDIFGPTDADVRQVTSRFTTKTLTQGADRSRVLLKLAIDDRPIPEQVRDFVFSANDGLTTKTVPLTVNIEPTSAPDVYLLIGQSNMVGFSGDSTRQAGSGEADEPNTRITQLNVSKNSEDEVFQTASDYTSEAANIAGEDIVIATDPLHIPTDSSTSAKQGDYIGLGLSFAKRALQDTTADIVLVPAAWSGSAFCNNSNGPSGGWNAQSSSNPNLGNTLMFDRAVTRANLALEKTNGILRGILWHQGESDGNDRCADLYADNLSKMIEGLRTRINADSRGMQSRQADSNIPFVAGTMSRGVDDRGDLSQFLPAKQKVDDAHNNLPSVVPFTGLSDHDDLIPSNNYPCGNTSCIHFGAAALREMGRRYYEAMIRALENPLDAGVD